MSIDANSTVTHSEAVIFSRLEDTVVLMNTDTGDYYDIDPVGSVVWEKIKEPKAIVDVCAEMCAEFDVTPAKCEADVVEFVAEMIDLGAVTLGGD